MKAFVVFAVFIVAAFAQENLEAAVHDPAKLKGIVDCFLEQGPCSPAAAELLRITPQALDTACGICTPEQKHLANVFFPALKKHLPSEYDNYVNKYDPKGDRLAALLKSVESF